MVALEKRDISKIARLASLTNPATFWNDVRAFTKNIKSDHSIKRWQCLAEQRYKEIKDK